MGADEYAAIEMSVTDLRRHLAAAIRAARDHGRMTLITSRGQGVAVISPLSLVPNPVSSLADEIERLHALTERGILTQEEFVQAKRKLISTD